MTEHDNVRPGAIDKKHSAVVHDNVASIAVRQCEVLCLQPARPDKFLYIRTPNTALRRATMWANNSYAAGANLARLTIRVGYIEPTRKVVRSPKSLRVAIEQFDAVDLLSARERA